MRHADPGHYRPPYAAEPPPPADRRPGGTELEAALQRYRAATRGAHGFTAVIATTRRLAALLEPDELCDPAGIEDDLATALDADRAAAGAALANLIGYYALTRHFADGRPVPAALAFDQLAEVSARLAGSLFDDADYFRKVARWLAVNIAVWAGEDAGYVASINDDSVAGLVCMYAEEPAKAMADFLVPPHKPAGYLEALLKPGATPRGGAAEIPDGTMVVLSSGHFQSLREALYKNSFKQVEGTPWPTAVLERGGAKGYAQLRPAVLDSEPLLPASQIEAWAQTMWRQQSELSDLDADALDALCAIYLAQAREPDDAAIADVDEILTMRGLKPKRGGQGRRGGFEPEQRAEMLRALSHIQNLWINIAEVKVYEKAKSGGKAKRPITKTLQSRPFLITDRMGQIRLDGYMDVERFIFRPGKAFAEFLFGSGRQTGLLFKRALQYDPYRRKWEKRLTRYVSWHWRAVARTGNFVQVYRVQTLLEAVGETLNVRYPSKTRARLERALDTLLGDGVIAGWEYGRFDERVVEQRGWGRHWLVATVVIEAPDPIKDYYARLAAGEDAAARPDAAPSLGQRIRRHRKATGLSQLQAAEQLGIQQGYLSKIERAKATPSAQLGRQIETWLHA